MRVVLTDQAVKRLKPRASRYDVWDAIVPGLCLRVTPSGHKSWSVLRRLRGRLKRVTLASYPAYGIAKARERAREVLEDLVDGKDPAGDSGITLGKALELYTAERDERGWGEGYAAGAKSAFKLHVPASLKSRPVQSIRRDEWATALAKVPGTAHAYNVRAYLSTFFTWALERGHVEQNPLAFVRLPKPRSRDRVYSDPEIAAIWHACGVAGWPVGIALRVAFITAQRRNQVRLMRRDQIDRERNIWTAPTKAKRLHPVPLSPLALETLSGAPEREPWVFSLTGETPFRQWERAVRLIRGCDGVPDDFRPHDLRRTAATRMAELGISPRVIDAVLDHAESGVTAIYQRYGYLDETRHALTLWSERLRAIVANAAT